MGLRTPAISAALAACLGLAASCSDGTAPASGPPARLALVSGDSQTGTVGRPLTEPLVVRVTDAAGRPVFLNPVRFAAVRGGGVLSPQITETDRDGVAQSVWTLGRFTGQQVTRVAVLDGPPDTLEFVANALAGPAAALLHAVGFSQSGFPGQPLGTPLMARVADSFGNPVSGIQVLWRILAGGGSLSETETVSDEHGLVSVRWTLGTAVTGIPDTVVAEADGLRGSPLAFTALVLPPAGSL